MWNSRRSAASGQGMSLTQCSKSCSGIDVKPSKHRACIANINTYTDTFHSSLTCQQTSDILVFVIFSVELFS